MQVVKASGNAPKKRRMRGKVDLNKVMLKRIMKVTNIRFTEPVINKLLDGLSERDQADWLKQYVKPVPMEKPVSIEDKLSDEQLMHAYKMQTSDVK